MMLPQSKLNISMTLQLPRMPIFYKLTFVFSAYMIVLVLQAVLMRYENFPKMMINETSETEAYVAHIKGFFGVSSVVTHETEEKVQVMVQICIYMIFSIMLLLVICAPICFYLRGLRMIKRMKVLMNRCLRDGRIFQERRIKRICYVEDKEQEILLREMGEIEALKIAGNCLNQNCIMRIIQHDNLLINYHLQSNVPKTNLQRMMFANLRWLSGLGYIIITRMLKDVLLALEYCHSRNVYHLDVHARNIMIFKMCDHEKGLIAKLGGLHYAVKSDSGVVLSSGVGLAKHLRPPECFKSSAVEAAKIDTYGLGICAYDCYTGGIFTILSDEEQTIKSKFSELVARKFLLRYGDFISSLDAAWNYFGTTLRMMTFAVSYTDMYDLKPSEFPPDCYRFVISLLRTQPHLRANASGALQSNLMKKVRIKRSVKKVRKLNKKPITEEFVA